jgi:glycosyltransferase involved in cell wall biosynthesis
MNILFICSAKTWGGNEKWVSIAMRGLKGKHKVFFLGREPGLHKRFGADIPAFWAPFRSVFDRKSKRVIEGIVKQKGIDVIISTKKKEYFLAGLVSRTAGIKHILRLGIVRKMHIPFWHHLIYGRLNDGIIVNAHRIKSCLLKYAWLKHHPIRVIYNGMDVVLNPVGPVPDKDRFTIVSAGMLTKRKGFHILIEAVSLLPSELHRKLRLYILGKGREEDSLKRFINERGMEEIVSLEGFCEPMEWLGKADLFCLLSQNEGISNALLEAMAYGVPVLTTNAGGASEFITSRENGFLVKNDVRLVAEQLAEIMNLSSDQLKLTGKKGKQTVQTLFDMGRMTDEVEMFLHNFV